MKFDVDKYDLYKVIEEYMHSKRWNLTKFSKVSGLTRRSIYDWRDGAKPTEKSIKLLFKNVPDILDVYHSSKEYTSVNSGMVTREQAAVDKKDIPVYDLEVFAGRALVGASSESPEFYISSLFPDAEAALPVYGDSMYGKYRNGDYIVVKEKKDMSYINYGKPYLLHW